MEMQTSSQITAHEKAVIRIMRNLPPERIEQLVDFAQFLETRAVREPDEEATEATEEPYVDEEKWDELLARTEAKQVMRQMAREAIEEYRAGETTDIEITQDGRLAPPSRVAF